MKFRIIKDEIDSLGRVVRLEDRASGAEVNIDHWTGRTSYPMTSPNICCYMYLRVDGSRGKYTHRDIIAISDCDSDYLQSGLDTAPAEAVIDFVAERLPDPWLRDLLSVSTVTR